MDGHNGMMEPEQIWAWVVWLILAMLVIPPLQVWWCHLRPPSRTLLMWQRYAEAWWLWRWGKTDPTGQPVTQPVLHRGWVDLDQVSVWLLHAIWVQEDISYFRHRGVAWDFFMGGLRHWAFHKGPLMGYSTLSQQLARSLFLVRFTRLLRKWPELYYTFWLEALLDKQRIFELYINYVETGWLTFGMAAAARQNFDAGVETLDEEQAIQLAALLPAPDTWRVHEPTPNYLKQQERIRPKLQQHPFPYRALFGEDAPEAPEGTFTV